MGETTKKPQAGEAWQSPPSSGRPDWAAVAATLRSRPGAWLLVCTAGRVTWADAIKRGRVNALRPDLGFEVSTNRNTRGYPRTCDLYMRFNPDKVDPLSDLLRESE